MFFKLSRFPATIILILTNLLVFGWCWYTIGSFREPGWSQGLLFRGAEFAPLTLADEGYRLITHMFLHGGLIHLLFNMYALFVVGSEVEQITGTRKFVLVYFLSGFAAALASLYFNLFGIGVGASGAIFGLFGFSLSYQLLQSREENRSVLPVLVNFFLFFIINLMFSKVMNADIAAHIGGLGAGVIIGLSAMVVGSFRLIRAEIIFLPVLILVFIGLPRYQVTYFNFYQKVLAIEDSTMALFDNRGLSDDQFVTEIKKIDLQWDTALYLLDTQPFLPEVLHNDTTKLRGYMGMRKQETTYRALLIEKETYRYLDSIDLTLASMGSFFPLDYPLNMLRTIQVEQDEKPTQNVPIKVWYDADWHELDNPPGEYYRIGSRDSLNRWQGPVQDFYKNGKIQMKGRYLDNEQHGIFIYYSDHDTYSSAGRYEKGNPVGKWEQFYSTGELEREEYFDGSYFVRNIWDSLGNQLVENGEGNYIKQHENGEIAIQGAYHEGRKDGYWYGNHRTGERYFEEYYTNGYLDRGRSRTPDGRTFIYDQSSFYPMPEGGNQVLFKYLETNIKAYKSEKGGVVKISFRVSKVGVLSDFQVDKSLDENLDSLTIDLIKKGPTWIPARQHGHLYQDGFGHVTVEF